jgi:hypothetical protein
LKTEFLRVKEKEVGAQGIMAVEVEGSLVLVGSGEGCLLAFRG